MSQTVLPDAIDFHQGKPFYDMVSAYITALIGLESVFDQSNRMGRWTQKPSRRGQYSLQLVVNNVTNKRPPFAYKASTSGSGGSAFWGLVDSPIQRQISLTITKTW